MHKIIYSLSIILLTSCGLDPNFKMTRFEKPIEILGCTQSFADNYDANSTQDDGTCVFMRCLDETQDNFNNSNIDAITEYITKYNLSSDKTLISNCNGRSACIHNLSSNKDPLGTKENGACLFKACLDDNYHEYNENNAIDIKDYLTQWGENYQGNSRVESTCQQKRRYCKNPQAANYTGPTESRGEPYCIFHACTKVDYEGHQKYLEFLDFLKTHPGEIIEDNSSTMCGNKLACIHPLSKNNDPQGTKENGSCLFKACLDENYHEYIKDDADSINQYLAVWGDNYQGNYRIESTCSQKRRYCKNADASNYTGATESRGDPYCIFYACTKSKYLGYQKYVEFQIFLQTHPGEIIEDNSDTRCGPKLVSKNIREIDINKQSLKSPVDVVFIIDDSASMEDEVSRVREGLVAIAPTLKNFNAEINIELHKISEVNKHTKTTTLSNTATSKIQRTEYLRPNYVDRFKIDETTNLNILEEKIGTGLDKIMEKFGNGQERGACYIQRILEDFKTNSSKNLISILITDEDDHEKGSSKNCYSYSDRNLLISPNEYEHHPYTDSMGKDDLINVISEGVVQLQSDKKFGFGSIHWNSQTATCPNGQGFHAENYIRLVNQLKNHKKIAIEGDICQTDYEPVLEKTLADTIREIIGYKYLVGALNKNPVITKVELVQQNQNVIELNANDYIVLDDGVNVFIQIHESLRDLLKDAAKVRIYVTEDQ